MRRAAALTAVLVLSLPVFGVRFLNDMEYYALVADKLLAGGVLYRDALDTKPPFVFYHYAFLFRVFGANNITAVKVATLAWLAASALIVAAIHRGLFPRSMNARLAALLFLLASFSGWADEFLSSNTEVLSNLFVLAGVWLLVADDFGDRAPQLVAAGMLLGTAFLYRYQAAAGVVAYASTLAAFHRWFSRPLRRIVWLTAGFVVPIAAFLAYYAAIGALDAVKLVVWWQTQYARNADPLYWPLVAGRVALATIGLLPVLFLALRESIAIVRADSRSKAEAFLLFLFAWSTVTFFIGGRLYPHYIVALIPAMVLLASIHPTAPRALPPSVASAAVFLVVNSVYAWTRPPDARHPDLATFVAAETTASDQVLLWTWQPRLLIELNRTFATRFLQNEPLIGRLNPIDARLHPDAPAEREPAVAEFWPIFLDDLDRSRPRLIIDEMPDRSPWSVERYPALAAVVAAHYEPCRVLDGLCAYLRKRR